ncbi:MAG: hypothetical protein JW822_08555 [Spirochaetales bacterium]|nr:hypothetical protein [Spirochaetales bacterium]
MPENFYKIYEEEFADGFKGDILFLDLARIKKDYNYAGLWYACDKNEETYIATEVYYSQDQGQKRPPDFSEEISENSFKHSPRYTLSLKYSGVWIATRIEKGRYCGMKAFSTQTENTYINYKVIRNRGESYDTLHTGIIKGSKASFFKLGIEDKTGEIDYNDTIMFVVLIKDLPPDDWHFNPAYFGVQKLPVLVPAFLFPVRQKYTDWLGQNPSDNVSI